MDRKPLILVVDIDDDIGQVLGENIIVGAKNVEKAVLEYGRRRPEDADVNAMLAGLNLYEEFKRRGLDPEIAVVGGHPVDNLEAQRNIKSRVKRLVEKISRPVEFYIVSDGEDELMVAEVLHDLGSIGGFRRVVVEQHLGIEGSYLLILKYIKKAVNDQRYARYVVGLPGAGLLLIALTALFNMASVAIELVALLLGLAMIVRGFGLEESLEASLRRLAEGIRENPHFTAAGIIMFLLFTAAGVYSAYETIVAAGVSVASLASILRSTVPLLGAGIVSYLVITRIFYKASYGNLSIMREIEAIVVVIFFSAAFYNLGVYLGSIAESSKTIPLSAFIESGFVQYVIIGTGVAALLELIRRGASGRSS